MIKTKNQDNVKSGLEHKNWDSPKGSVEGQGKCCEKQKQKELKGQEDGDVRTAQRTEHHHKLNLSKIAGATSGLNTAFKAPSQPPSKQPQSTSM